MTEELPAPVDAALRVASAVFAIVFALVVASALATPFADLAVRLGLVADGGNGWQLLRTLGQFAGFLVAVAGYLVFTDQRDLLRFSRPSLREVGIVFGAGILLLGLQYSSLFALREVGLSTGQNQAVVPAGDPVGYYLAMVAVSLFVVGPVEEVLFRGVVQGGLRRAFDAPPAILLASVLFGLVHLSGIQGTAVERWAYVAVVILLGCVLGYLYERTGNVLVPGLAHGVYNAAIYAVLLANAV
ncbi:CPBP family intramembrane metalloprotease [Halorubrum sp. 48-1-W]|uniref:CPBP family intramembrane glutamic endopeptidase n=1 Tax=Halorubrum sp. 48-1-W TaxID=2249761 RepID=UPI000DCE724C|nr:CPBP family intramembrane glutamic endopeptidase [Halorubrum sp. 48-1-W]RAW45111.1 CPBP family intramembrane metalloprotease [Halorubrum sp. 48-1-W]